MDGKENWHAPGAGTKDGDSFMQEKIDCTINKDDNRSDFFFDFFSVSVFILWRLFIEILIELRWNCMDLFSFVDRKEGMFMSV